MRAARTCTPNDPRDADQVQLLVGQWRSPEPVGAAHNLLEADESGQGQAQLHIVFTQDGASHTGRFHFDVQWGATDDDRFVFLMDGQSPPEGFSDDGSCDTDDSFDMDCRLAAEGQSLDCDGEGNWSEYDFRWRRSAAPSLE